MTKRLAIKRLTKSDLTLFKWHFEHNNAGNQKAINLNADVFVSVLFPTLPEEAKASGRGGKFSIDLDIFGPGKAPRLNLQRKIVKFGEYKNWRLNGEFVDNPTNDVDRFNILKEGDFAFFEFQGVYYPEAVRMALISEVNDKNFHAICESFLGSKKMLAVSGEELDYLLSKAGLHEDFPLVSSSIELALEDAVQGGLDGVRKLQKRSVTRSITKEELRAARDLANDIGAIGEEFVNDYLATQNSNGIIKNYKWVSIENAIAPYDFIVTKGNENIMIDVKTTKGGFEGKVHISINELLHMADGNYVIYRVYKIEGNRSFLRISEPMSDFAEKVLNILNMLPQGVYADGISVDPTQIGFGGDIALELKNSDE